MGPTPGAAGSPLSGSWDQMEEPQTSAHTFLGSHCRAVSVPFYSLISFFFNLFFPHISVQLSVNNKPPNPEGQGEKKDNATAPPAPPTYEEATAGEGMKASAYPPPPSVPLHPSWAYVDPSKSSCGCTRGEPLAKAGEGCRDCPGACKGERSQGLGSQCEPW